MTTIEMINACKLLQAKLGNDRASITYKIAICASGNIEVTLDAYHHIAGHSKEYKTITEAVSDCISKAPTAITTTIAEMEKEIEALKAKQTLLLAGQ